MLAKVGELLNVNDSIIKRKAYEKSQSKECCRVWNTFLLEYYLPYYQINVCTFSQMKFFDIEKSRKKPSRSSNNMTVRELY